MEHLSKSSKQTTMFFASNNPEISCKISLKSAENDPIEKENALLTTPKIPATGFTPFFTISFPFAFTYIR